MAAAACPNLANCSDLYNDGTPPLRLSRVESIEDHALPTITATPITSPPNPGPSKSCSPSTSNSDGLRLPLRSAPRQCELCGFKYRVALSPSDQTTINVCASRYDSPSVAAIAAATQGAIVRATPTVTAAPDTLIVPSSCMLTHADQAPASAGVFRCTRCGLISMYDVKSTASTDSDSTSNTTEMCVQPLLQSCIMEAARAYKFILLSETSPLLKDLAQIVVDYLLWYRGPSDFKVGDLVDAKDLRNKWHLARVEAIENGKLLIHFLGFAARWNQWISLNSNALAPCHTKTKEKQDAYSVKLKSTMTWTKKLTQPVLAQVPDAIEIVSSSSSSSTSTTKSPRFSTSRHHSSSASSGHASQSGYELPYEDEAIFQDQLAFGSPLSSLASSSSIPSSSVSNFPLDTSFGPSSIPKASSVSTSSTIPTQQPPSTLSSHPSSLLPTVNYSILTRPAPSTLIPDLIENDYESSDGTIQGCQITGERKGECTSTTITNKVSRLTTSISSSSTSSSLNRSSLQTTDVDDSAASSSEVEPDTPVFHEEEE